MKETTAFGVFENTDQIRQSEKTAKGLERRKTKTTAHTLQKNKNNWCC